MIAEGSLFSGALVLAQMYSATVTRQHLADLDPRDGIFTVWITATTAGLVLSTSLLAYFADQANRTLGPFNLTLRVTRRKGVAAISVRGNRAERNTALASLSAAFYQHDYKWVWTVDDFGWLKR